MRGRFITVEGLDGAGKTTHLAAVQKLLEGRRLSVRITREPGGTALGEALRSLLLSPAEPLNPETEALLMFGARREHIERVITPALDAGVWVLCDRFTDATFAYQAGGSGVSWQKIAALEQWVQGTLQPDLTLYFDVDPETARARARALKAPDRFESEHKTFQERVQGAYLRRAAECARIHVIDANRGIADVQQDVEQVIVRFCSNACASVSARK